MRESINNFQFKRVGYGHYKVTYTSPKTYKQWCIVTTDMQLIDATKNEDEPKQKDLKTLKYFCKRG